MKPELYAQALLALVKSGEKPVAAVEKLHASLKKHGRTALMPHIARSFSRLATRDLRKNRSALYIATKADEKKARASSKADSAAVVLDETLLGGWRLEESEQLIDASWKKHLLALYNRITS